MEATSSSALKAYADALKRTQNMDAATPSGGTADSTGGSFADMVKSVVNQATDSTQKSENASMSALAGLGDPIDVVTAMTSAEATLQTVVAVRDKIISAYQEIMHMPI